MASSWIPAHETVVYSRGQPSILRKSDMSPARKEALQQQIVEEGAARIFYEMSGAGDFGIPKNVTEEALRADGISRQDYAESESSNEVTEEDWQKIRQLLRTQGLRVKGRDIDAATEFKETGMLS